MKKSTIFLLGFIFLAGLVIAAELTDSSIKKDMDSRWMTEDRESQSLIEKISISSRESDIDAEEIKRIFREDYVYSINVTNLRILDGQTEMMPVCNKTFIKWEILTDNEFGGQTLMYAVQDYDGGEIEYYDYWMDFYEAKEKELGCYIEIREVKNEK